MFPSLPFLFIVHCPNAKKYFTLLVNYLTGISCQCFDEKLHNANHLKNDNITDGFQINIRNLKSYYFFFLMIYRRRESFNMLVEMKKEILCLNLDLIFWINRMRKYVSLQNCALTKNNTGLKQVITNNPNVLH